MQVGMVTDSRTLHHYWSHTDVTPWSADGRLMLSQRADVGGVQDMLEGSRPHLVQEIGYTNFTAGSSLFSCLMTIWNDMRQDLSERNSAHGMNSNSCRMSAACEVWVQAAAAAFLKCRPRLQLVDSYVTSVWPSFDSVAAWDFSYLPHSLRKYQLYLPGKATVTAHSCLF